VVVGPSSDYAITLRQRMEVRLVQAAKSESVRMRFFAQWMVSGQVGVHAVPLVMVAFQPALAPIRPLLTWAQTVSAIRPPLVTPKVAVILLLPVVGAYGPFARWPAVVAFRLDLAIRRHQQTAVQCAMVKIRPFAELHNVLLNK